MLLHVSEYLEINQTQTDVINEGKNFLLLSLENYILGLGFSMGLTFDINLHFGDFI